MTGILKHFVVLILKKRGNEMDRQQASKILKNTGYIGNEIGVAFDVAIKSMDKLDKIEQIVSDWKNGNIEGNDTILAFHMIKEVLENE